MKRKFLSILSLVLAIAMILPMGVFVSADDTEEQPEEITEITLKLGNEEISSKDIIFSPGDTYTLTATGGDNKNYSWLSSNPGVASVNNGVVTPKTEGTVTITVASAGKTKSCDIKFISKTCTDITLTGSYRTEYVSGESFEKDKLKITATYNDDTTAEIGAGKCEFNPDRAFKVGDTSISVSYGGITKTITGITVSEKVVDKVEIVNATTKFTEGDKLPALQVNVTFNDKTTITLTSGYKVLVNGSEVASNYTFKTTDKTIAVSYSGVPSTAVNITVAAKQSETETPSTSTPARIVVTTPPTKTAYKVGEELKIDGLKANVVDANGKALTISSTGITVPKYTFKESDIGKTSITISNASFTYNKNLYYLPITIEGITITDAAETLAVASIEEGGVELEESKYPIGHTFTLSDIYRVYYYKSTSLSSRSYISGYDIVRGAYTNNFDIQVLGSNGKLKSKNSSKIEEDDVLTDSKGGTYVQLRFYIDSKYIDFDVDVGSSGVSYYYDDDLIAVYDDIDEALEYTITQDKNVSGFILSLVKDSKDIVLKLGEDQSISPTNDDFDPEHNIVIDLNGHSLTFYTDTVDITKSNSEYTITITNTSSTAGKFIYSDKDVTMTVAKNEKLVFEYDKDIPGIYTVTLDVGSNGSVTTTPKASSDEITVGHGTDIKFTITPASGYSVNTIKADSKTVSSSDYTKASNGVVTYTLKAVSKSQKVEITFKKDETKWNNPFTDVRSTDSYYSAVQFVYENELFKGTTTTKFSPDTTMTRAMFVTVLGRLANVDVSRYKTSSYSDVPLNNDTAWYAPYVEWATNMGLVEGYGDGTFGPNNKITHQQMYVLMYRYTIFVENKSVSLKSTSINASDAEDVADWAKDAVKFASQNNFLVKISTTSSRIDPTGEAKRCELAQLLEQYCKIILEWDK